MLKIQLADNTQTAKGRQGGAGMSDNAHADSNSHNNITMLMTSDKQQKQQQQQRKQQRGNIVPICELQLESIWSPPKDANVFNASCTHDRRLPTCGPRFCSYT